MKTSFLILLLCLVSLPMHSQFLLETHTGVYSGGAYDRTLSLLVFDDGHVEITDAVLTGEDLAQLDAGVWASAALDLEIDFEGRTLHLRRDTSGKYFARWGTLDEFPLSIQDGC